MRLLLKTGTHKYRKRWRGPDGNWDYEYEKPPEQQRFRGGALTVRKMMADKSDALNRQMRGFKRISDGFYEKRYTDDKGFRRWIQIHLDKKAMAGGKKHELKLIINDFIETTSKKEMPTGPEKKRRETMNRKLQRLIDKHGPEVAEWPSKAKRQLRTLREKLGKQRKEVWGVDHDFDPITIKDQDDYLPAWKEAMKTARQYMNAVMRGSQEKVKIRTKSVLLMKRRKEEP